VEFTRMFHLSMSFDHRLINGAPAARFLHEAATRMETLADLESMPQPNAPEAVAPSLALESELRQLVAEMQGVAPSLVDLECKVTDLASDSLGLLTAEMICEEVSAFLNRQRPLTIITPNMIRQNTLRDLVRLVLE
jgi:hypothetical protein